MRPFARNIIVPILTALCLLMAPEAFGRPGSDYAATSVLAEGSWVKISTDEAGIYQITDEQLAAWGFSDPSKVKLFGYGGLVIDELFANDDNYIDDLPQIPLWRHNGKLYFYSTGTTRWTLDNVNLEFAHRLHPYSTHAYYFLTDREVPAAEMPLRNGIPTDNESAVSTYDAYTVHEQELVSVGKTGQNFFGESFTQTAEQDFTFHLTGAQSATLKIRVNFGAKISSGEGYIHISYNGTELPAGTANRISKYYDSHEFLRQATPLHTVGQATEESTIGLRYEHSGPSEYAYLDYIRLNYRRALQLYDGQVAFRFINRRDNDCYQIGNTTDSTQVWDITSPHAPQQVATAFDGQTTRFVPGDIQLREFIAFDPGYTFPSPTFVKQVENQNLHASPIPDLTIITPTVLRSEAERVARLHQAEGLTTLVVDQEQIFNEFSSGTPDATAYRRLMKMFYDRDANESERPRYLLLFGDGSYNNRQAMASLHTPQCNSLLTYQSKTSIDERESFVVEDYFGFLEDGSGTEIKTDRVCLGIGRYPVTSLQTARLAVDKLYQYAQNTDLGPWKNTFCIAADDGDEAVHTKQADQGCDTLLLENTDTPRLEFRVNKVYVDSYYLDPVSKKCPDANRELMKNLDEGVLVFNYIGHNDAEVGFTGEGLFSRYEMDNLTNSRWPLFITITCSYTRFDEEDLTAGENVLLNPTAGAIVLITTTRVVYTDGNDKINRRLMNRLLSRDENGNSLRIGDVLKLAKRDFNTEIDKNKLNFVLLGDPALRLFYPQNKLKITRAGSTGERLAVYMKPGKSYTVGGEVYDYGGQLLDDFNGEVYYSLYDEKKSFTTLAHQDKKTYTYNYRPDLLSTGKGSVENGRFHVDVTLPVENSHSGKSALLILYACDPTSGQEANGYTEELFVDSIAGNSTLDSQGPAIQYAGVNTRSYADGASVANPATFYCQMSDPSGIYTGNTLGRQMMLLLNGSTLDDNPVRYFRPSTDGSTGELAFPLPTLQSGNYTITLRVFDNAGNSSEVNTTFEITPETSSYILSLDENPVTELATLSCLDTEGREIGEVKQARIAIVNSLGEEVWYRETTGSNPFPITWNLLDLNGQRVPAGRYECRAYLETESGTLATPSKKIVVITQ